MTDTKCEPPGEWEATCGVCGSLYGWNSDDEPPAHGVFCSHCRSNGLSAPGVLHFARVPPPAPAATPDTVRALVEALEAVERDADEGMIVGEYRAPAVSDETRAEVCAALARAKAEGLA